MECVETVDVSENMVNKLQHADAIFRCRACSNVFLTYDHLRCHLKLCDDFRVFDAAQENAVNLKTESGVDVFRSIILKYDFVYQKERGIYCEFCCGSFVTTSALKEHAILCRGGIKEKFISTANDAVVEIKKRKRGRPCKHLNQTANPVLTELNSNSDSPGESSLTDDCKPNSSEILPVLMKNEVSEIENKRPVIRQAKINKVEAGVPFPDVDAETESFESDETSSSGLYIRDVLIGDVDCRYCGKAFRNVSIAHHIRRTHGYEHVCFDCQEVKESAEDIMQHVDTVHGEDNRANTTYYSCPLCSAKIKMKSGAGHLYRHMRLTHGASNDEIERYSIELKNSTYLYVGPNV